MQTVVITVLALASDRSLASAAIDACPPGSPLHAFAISKDVTNHWGAIKLPDVSHVEGRFAVAPAPPGALPRAPNSAAAKAASRLRTAASAVSHAVTAAVSRGGKGKADTLSSANPRFSVSKAASTQSAGASGSPQVLLVQPIVHGASTAPAPGRQTRRGLRSADAVPDVLASDLRSSTLSFLLDPSPTPFPGVGASLLAAGALAIGAANLQQLQSGTPTPGLLPTPFPRLYSILRLDTAAALMVLGRLFTASADAIASAVWLAEGVPGAVARHRCLPGEWPAIGAPAGVVEIRIQANVDNADPAASPTTTDSTAPPAKLPSLQSLLQAIAEVALSTAIAESSTSRSANAGAAAFRRGGGAPSLASQADALDMSASAASPRLALLLLFIAYQVSRTGPGVPPIVLDSPAAGVPINGSSSAIASAVRLAALYLCSPAPAGKRTGSAVSDGSAATSASGCLSDSSWVLHDGVIETLVSFSSRCDLIEGCSAAA